MYCYFNIKVFVNIYFIQYTHIDITKYFNLIYFNLNINLL